MRRVKLFQKIILLMILLGWGGVSIAAPVFTDKENALNLSEVLDKGVFQKRLITSTFIQSTGKDQYFIKVILDNGAEQNWNLRQIREFTKNDSLVLQDNQVLLFPNEDNHDFVVLDKNLFAQTALRSQVFIKQYGPPDVLVGQKIIFGVHRFNLVNLLKIGRGKDNQGYPYKYILDLENGQREYLSYLEAYQALERKGLIENPTGIAPVLRSPYRLISVRGHSLQKVKDSGFGRFVVELVFDRPIELHPGHYPFRFFEKDPNKNKGNGSNFVVEITAPNAALGKYLKPIRVLEYLHDIRVVNDPNANVRLLLRANMNPEVMNIPPEVNVRGNSVMVSFTKVVDQTVLDPKALEEADLRMRQEQMLSRTLTPEEVARRKAYRGHMKEAHIFLNRARRAGPFTAKIEMMDLALKGFERAAQNASSDRELQDALRRRNTLTINIPTIIVSHISRSLGRRKTDAAFKGLLEKAAVISRDEQVVRQIKKLLKDPRL